MGVNGMYIMVFVTATSKYEAEKIAKSLIKHKLAACVNIVPKVSSLFFWKGKIDRAKEFLLLIKSKKIKFTALVKQVKLEHSYKVPEIIALPIIAGDKNYLRWLDAALR